MSHIKVLLIAAFAARAFAGTYTAANCQQATVNALINGPGEDATHHVAVNGDVIRIPSGSCTWASGVTTPAGAAITITGTGTPDSDPTHFGASASCSGTTITVGNTGVTAFAMTPTYGNGTTRLSCLALNYSGTGGPVGFKIQGTCTASGCPLLRMDNLSFGGWNTRAASSGISAAIGAIGNMFGVIDHNTVTPSGSDGGAPAVELTLVSLGSYLGVGHYGDKDYAMSENWGSDQFLFMENNRFNDTSATEHEGSAGGYEDEGGGRLVVRFNEFLNMSRFRFAVGWHGTESNGRPRGIHAFEVYKNTDVCAEPTYRCMAQVSARSGTGLVWGNALSGGNGVDNLFEPTVARASGGEFTPWGNCDGAGPYDINDPTIYWSGTIASVNDTTKTITVSGTPSWTTNQWATDAAQHYSVHNSTITANTGVNTGAIIGANTSNQLTVGWFQGALNYAPGDSIQIRKPIACMDSAGRGSGVLYDDNYTPLVSGVPNISTAQALVPSYVWANTFSATPARYAGPWPYTGTIVRNREYYVEEVGQTAQTSAVAPFDGTATVGIGHGTLATINRRPTTCTAGTAYWATDEGEWDSTNGATPDGKLYKCTATNTWTAYYTPYTYPHPLISGDPPPDPPVGNGGSVTTGKTTISGRVVR